MTVLINRYNDWSFHSLGNSYLFQIELISLLISEWIVLPPALISSAGILSVSGDLWLFNFSVANLTSKALGSGTSGSAVFISVRLTSLTSCTFSGWEKWFLYLAKILWESNQITLLIRQYISPMLVTFLKSLMPLYKSLIVLILLLISSSSILAFRYSFFLFLKCWLASHHTLFRLMGFYLMELVTK